MKKISKIVSTLAVSLALAMGATVTAFAAVTFQDYQLTVTGSGEYTATDLFDNFKGVMPGDTLDQPVTVTNNNGEDINVYLRAEAHDEVSNPLTYSEAYEEADGNDQATDPENGIGGAGQRDETVATMQDFLTQLHLTVSANDVVAFDGAPSLGSENIFLGEIEPGESMVINATLAVPIELSDAYANRVGEVDWVFTVEELDKPSGGLATTGDALPLQLLAGIACAAAVLVVVAALAQRRRGLK